MNRTPSRTNGSRAASRVASRLRTIHDSSVARHRALLESGADPEDMLVRYFDDLACYLEGTGGGCPFTEARSTAHENGGKAPDQAVLDEVVLHKRFHRDFFVDVAKRLTRNEKRAIHVGEVFFLLYSGATTEAQNTGELWPVTRARHAALELSRSEKNRAA